MRAGGVFIVMRLSDRSVLASIRGADYIYCVDLVYSNSCIFAPPFRLLSVVLEMFGSLGDLHLGLFKMG